MIDNELIEQIYDALTRTASKKDKHTAKENADAMMGEVKQTPVEKHRTQMENFAGTCLYFLIAFQNKQDTIIAQNQRIIELLERGDKK